MSDSEKVGALELGVTDAVQHQVHHADAYHLARYIGAEHRGFKQTPVRIFSPAPLR